MLSNKNEELWLVTTAGSIDGDKNKRIAQYYLDDSCNLTEKNYNINELLDFAFDPHNTNILPASISQFIKYFKQ